MVYTVVNTVDKETMERELREAFKLFDKEVSYSSRNVLLAVCWKQGYKAIRSVNM